MPVLLVVCQIDLPGREVSFEEAQAWATGRLDVAFAETSALTGEGIKEALEKSVGLFHKYRTEGVYNESLPMAYRPH
jgi:hypothetical protein